MAEQGGMAEQGSMARHEVTPSPSEASNEVMAVQPGYVRSLLGDRIAAAAVPERGVTFIVGDRAEKVSWSQLFVDAIMMADALRARGVRPRDHVAILGPTTRTVVTAIEATWLAGAVAVMLPLPMRLGSVEEFVGQTRARIRNADAAIVLVDPDLAPFLDACEGDPPLVTFEDVVVNAPTTATTSVGVSSLDPDDLAILQFTSGSTAEPKGVMLPHSTVCANLDAIVRGVDLLVGRDVAVSWLPLYHDMGLIGLLTVPMTTGIDLVLAGPQDFLASPGRWLRWISDHRGTITAGPNFSYALAARAMTRMTELDLSSWRVALNGAEPVDPQNVDAFVRAGASHGLDPRAVFCAFGMAEATLAVAFPEPLSGMRTDIVDRRVLETDRYASAVSETNDNARRFAILGRPVDGLELRIVDTDSGAVMGEREVGELQISGASVTPGYFRRADATAASFDGAWLRTGDLAYLVNGELVVCGRMKDVIIVGGRNVWPEDIERSVATIDGVRAGNVIAFGVEGRRGKEVIAVVAEVKADDPETVRSSIAERVRATIGIPAAWVVLVRPGSLPKTSSGKLQRSLCRERLLVGALELLEAPAVTS